ncbi:hypothetical protein [Shewanella benthica]|uniref:hypothetical protein n=1 Tax=Shewanella benthica TaxID=43661 RepID=UPI0012FD49C3|nr:hypothetical protein [Shewanella benthica]
MVFAPSSLILTNYFSPVIWALTGSGDVNRKHYLKRYVPRIGSGLRKYHLIFLVIISLFGCEQKSEITSKQVKAEIVQALQVGDDAKAIESYRKLP